MGYRILFAAAALRDLRRLPQQQQLRISRSIDELEANPRPAGVVKLTGREEYRIRVGDYRVLYTIADDGTVVRIGRLAHRREAYRR